MNPDMLSFLPQDNEEVQFFQETASRFKMNEMNMVALESDDIFSHESLTALRKATRAIQKIKGVRHVMSLTNLLNIGRAPDGSTLVKPWINPEAVPVDPEVLAEIRHKVLADPMLAGSLVSEDGRAAMASFILDKDADKQAMARKIREAVTDAVPGRKVYFNGLALVQESMQSLVARDMGRLMPFTVLVILLVLFLGTGSLRGVVLPLSTVIVATVWCLGTMALAGMQLSVLTAVIPLVVIVLGTVPGIYLIVRYYEEEFPNARERTEHVLARESGSLLRAGFVLTAGFLTLMLSDLAVYKEFGKAAAFGIFWSVALSLTFLPACLTYLSTGTPWKRSLAAPQSRLATVGFSRLAGFVARRKTGILVVASGLCIAALALTLRVPRHMDMMSYFPEGSEPYEAELLMQKYFGGSQLVQVNFRAEDVRRPAILEQMEILEKRLRLIPDVHYPQSVADVLRALNLSLNGEPGLPDIINKINDLWFFLEGQPSVEILLDKHYVNGVVGARIGDSSPEVVARAVEEIRTMVEETVSENLFLVNPGLQPPALRRAFLEELAARIALKAALDVKFHTGREIPRKGLAAALGPLLWEPPSLDAGDRQLLKKGIERYLASEEADVRIGQPSLIPRVSEALSKLPNVTLSSVNAVLNKTMPPSAYEAAPEDVAYSADFIRMMFAQKVREKRFREAMLIALRIAGIPAEGSDHPGLRNDLAGDMWGVNNAYLGVNSETWFRITGREPPWEGRMEFEVRLTGLPVINMKYDGILVTSIIKSTFNALVIVLVLLIFLMRSAGRGFAAVSPLLFSFLLVLGTMGLLGMSVDNMTVVFLGIALGTSVMYALPLVARGMEGMREGKTQEQALEDAMTTRGRAILINTLTLAPGFGVLVFSSMAPQRQVGFFIALALLLANIGAFFILPALMLRRKKPGS